MKAYRLCPYPHDSEVVANCQVHDFPQQLQAGTKQFRIPAAESGGPAELSCHIPDTSMGASTSAENVSSCGSNRKQPLAARVGRLQLLAM